MRVCPFCSYRNPVASRFCGACARPLDATSTPTQPIGPGTALARADEGRFLPGTLINGRYRVMGLLGRGGMGEVYRASDLALGQQVALKFLSTPDDPSMARFHDEVRIARQVSHPNVCRVYDIGEVNGHPFLSMEYVDGEDLGSLLRRIGRLAPDKATEIARRLCAGLAAAHENGVLHRDLKPANIMIDGRGQVRITDFGLAAAGRVADVRSGTPAYMSPEQLEGREVTARSDIYALGLVLYELYTGRFLEPHERAAPPSSRDLDPAVERIIQRCLAPEPRNRPASALAVAAALPGGDPLAAALAAGETPSPELVAAAGEGEAMPVRTAWACLGLALLGCLALVPIQWYAGLLRRVPLEKPPEALAERAGELAGRLGFPDPRDRAYGFNYNRGYVEYARRGERAAARLVNPPAFPPLVTFWYRQSPYPLTANRRDSFVPEFNDPPFDTSGMVRLSMDPQGQLLFFESMPAEVERGNTPATPPDWAQLFAAAGLEMARFSPVAPEWTPLTAFDLRAAWTGTAGPYTVRVEAAAWRGKPVSFRIVGPWSRPVRTVRPHPGGFREAGMAVLQGVLWCLIAAGCLLAWRNVRLGRSDWRGAWRVAAAVFALNMTAWVLGANHVAGFDEFDQFWTAAGSACYRSGWLWLFYMALEPFMRRRWPQALIGWNRLLSGHFRDPAVGRETLLGMAALAVYAALALARGLLMVSAGEPLMDVHLRTLSGLRYACGLLAGDASQAAFQLLFATFLLVLLRAVIRRDWAALAAFVAIMSTMSVTFSPSPFVDAFMQPLGWMLAALILLRFGLLAGLAFHLFGGFLMVRWPLTTDLSAWYAGLGIFVLLLAAGCALFAFRSATMGRKLFPGNWMEI